MMYQKYIYIYIMYIYIILYIYTYIIYIYIITLELMQWPVIHVMFFSNSHMFPQRLCDLFKLDPQNPAA